MSSVKDHLKESTATSHATSGKREAEPNGQRFRPLTYNAYRILGLSCSASQNDIFEAASSQRRALKLGVSKTTLEDLPWLGPVNRSETDVRDALSRLSNPAQRIYERLFWFYDRAAAAYVKKLDELNPILDYLLVAGGQSGRHDAALLSLAVALRLSPAMENAAIWLRALNLWKETLEANDFWSLLMSSDLKGDFEQLVTFAEIRELRLRVLHLVSSPVADVARNAAARRDYAACQRALKVLRQAPLPEKTVARYENDILGPIEDELVGQCDEAFRPVEYEYTSYSLSNRKQKCDQTFYKYNERLKPSLKRFLDLAGSESLSVYRVFEKVATGLSHLARAYRSAGEEATALKFYERAWTMAPPGSLIAAELAETLEAANRRSLIRTRTEADYHRQLVEELQVLFIPMPSYPVPPPPVNETNSVGCSAIAIIFALSIAASFICNHSGGGGSYNPNPPGLYNANIYRPTYNANVYAPHPQFSPLPTIPDIKIEPLIIPGLEGGRRRPRARGKIVSPRRNPPQ